MGRRRRSEGYDPNQIIENVKENLREDIRKQLAPVLRKAADEVVEQLVGEVIAELIGKFDIVLRPALSGGKEMVFVFETRVPIQKDEKKPCATCGGSGKGRTAHQEEFDCPCQK